VCDIYRNICFPPPYAAYIGNCNSPPCVIYIKGLLSVYLTYGFHEEIRGNCFVLRRKDYICCMVYLNRASGYLVLKVQDDMEKFVADLVALTNLRSEDLESSWEGIDGGAWHEVAIWEEFLQKAERSNRSGLIMFYHGAHWRLRTKSGFGGKAVEVGPGDLLVLHYGAGVMYRGEEFDIVDCEPMSVLMLLWSDVVNEYRLELEKDRKL